MIKIAKKPKVKCLICEEMFHREDEEFVVVGRRYAHKDCYTIGKDTVEEKKRDFEELEKYMKDLLKDDYVDSVVKCQMGRMMRQNDYTYRDLLNALKYFYEVKNGDKSKANGGIKIIPYVMADARKYYESIEKAKELNNGNEIKIEEKIIKIQSPTRKPKKAKLFRMEDDNNE